MLPCAATAKQWQSFSPPFLICGDRLLLNAFAKAFSQLSDRSIRRVVWISLAITAAVFIALFAVMGFLLTHTALFRIGWLDTIVDVLGGVATLVLTWLLFPAVVSSFVGLFLERVAEAVERRHYPFLGPAREASLSEVIATTLKFLGVMVAMNLVLLIFLLFPPVFPFVFYAVNGYLLGREYSELVALRRCDMAEMRSFRDTRRGQLFVAGLVIALLLTVPFVNLLAPVVGTAAMVHLFESWRSKA